MLTHVRQIIPTVQAEGPLLGTPSLLIRYDSCNLNCPWCDSKNIIKNKEYTNEYILNLLDVYKFKNIMITGGEPFLYADEISKLFSFILIENNYTFLRTVEIETNGTLITTKSLKKITNKINESLSCISVRLNISPKLSPDCYKQLNTPIDEILQNYERIFVTLVNYNTNNNFERVEFICKTVYSAEWQETILKLKEDLFNYIPSTSFIVMPLTPDINNYSNEYDFLMDYRKSCQTTVKFCIENAIKYCSREQIILFGKMKDEYDELIS